jgi:hypothetical protein
VTREAKLAGFVLLLIVIFAGAHAAGSHLGPVTTTHAQVSGPTHAQVSGPSRGMGGMTMGHSGGGQP